MRTLLAGAAAALALCATGAARATTLSFETPDVSAKPDSFLEIFDSAGFTWDNFIILYGPAYPFAAVVDGDQAASTDLFDNGAISAATPFTLHSGYFSSVATDGVTLDVRGLRGGVELFSDSFILNTGAPDLLTFGWSGIDRVEFQVIGGGDRPYFGLDRLLTSVPEPATWALLVGGFAVAGAALRRRRLAAI